MSWGCSRVSMPAISWLCETNRSSQEKAMSEKIQQVAEQQPFIEYIGFLPGKHLILKNEAAFISFSSLGQNERLTHLKPFKVSPRCFTNLSTPGPSRKARRLAWVYSRGEPWLHIIQRCWKYIGFDCKAKHIPECRICDWDILRENLFHFHLYELGALDSCLERNKKVYSMQRLTEPCNSNWGKTHTSDATTIRNIAPRSSTVPLLMLLTWMMLYLVVVMPPDAECLGNCLESLTTILSLDVI